MGAEQAPALEKVFGTLYVLSLDFVMFGRFKNIIVDLDAATRQDLADALVNILDLTVDVTLQYQRNVIGECPYPGQDLH